MPVQIEWNVVGKDALSPLLFSISTRIKTLNLGLTVKGGKGDTLGCLLYADAFVIIAKNKMM